MMTSAADDVAPQATAPKRRGPMNSREIAAVALIIFLVNGALVIWTPLWSLCFPLWLTPIVAVLWSVVLLLKERGRGTMSRGGIAFVTAVGCIVAVHAVLGANQAWFRCGVECRLWRVGGRERVESWVAQHVNSLQADWDRLGGGKGVDALPNAESHRFFFVHGADRPEWLAPLAAYLPPRVDSDSTSQFVGIRFSLSGWDHGWGLDVYVKPQPDAARRRWINRLSDRSFLWGQP